MHVAGLHDGVCMVGNFPASYPSKQIFLQLITLSNDYSVCPLILINIDISCIVYKHGF